MKPRRQHRPPACLVPVLPLNLLVTLALLLLAVFHLPWASATATATTAAAASYHHHQRPFVQQQQSRADPHVGDLAEHRLLSLVQELMAGGLKRNDHHEDDHDAAHSFTTASIDTSSRLSPPFAFYDNDNNYKDDSDTRSLADHAASLDQAALRHGFRGGWEEAMRAAEELDRVELVGDAVTGSRVAGDHVTGDRVVDLRQRQCPAVHVPAFPCQNRRNGDTSGNEINSSSNSSSSNSTMTPLYPRWRDIKLMAALGDSVTAGLFIRGTRATLLRHVSGLSTEDRGVVFAIGGNEEEGVVTVAGNAGRFGRGLSGSGGKLAGVAVTRTPSNTEPWHLPPLELDLARLSATINSSLTQAHVLTTRLSTTHFHAYRSHWKMVHIFLGAINLCQSCENIDVQSPTHPSAPDAVAQGMHTLLTYLYDNAPRDVHGHLNLHINVYTMFPSVTPLYDMGVGAGSLWCRKVQEAGDFCRCLFKGPRERGEMERLASVYNERVLEVVREWQGRTREAPILEERFRVSAVRALEQIDLAKLGAGYISRADCFHPNDCYHRFVAYKAWRAMSLNDNALDDRLEEDGRTLRWDACDVYDEAVLRELS